MSDTTNAMATPFDFELTNLTYVTSSGQSVDLRAIFTEINIYQDIFSNMMSGQVIVTDSTNIFAYLVQAGSEFIQISLDKPGLDQPINKTFRIYNRRIILASPSNQTVTLYFCSEEMLVSKSLSFSKIYNNMTISDMVKDIVNNVLKNPKPINILETTSAQQTLTIPYFTPFQAINWLSSKATSAYVGATFMFYEDNNGYNFQSIQKMMDVSGPIATYNYNVKNIADNNSNLDFYDASTFQVIKTPNTLEGLVTGSNASRLLTLDVLRQKFTIGDLNGTDLFNASTSLGNGPSFNTFQNRLKNNAADSYGSFRKFYPTNIGQNQAKYIQGKTQINPNGVESWLLERNAQIMQLMGNRVKLVVPGNNMLNAGQVIQYNMPSIEPQTGSSEGSTQRKLDPYMTGLWLITALRHRITIRTFETVLELARDGIQQPFPNAQNQNSSILGFA